jgi:hypothetical protein
MSTIFSNERSRRVVGMLLLGVVACGDGSTGPEAPPPPTVDGVMDQEEWDGATLIPISGDLIPGKGPSTLLVTTDGTDLFIGLHIQDLAQAEDALSVRIDNDNDNVHTPGDDLLTLALPDDFYDLHFSGTSYVGDIGQHGRGSVGQAGAWAFYEISHPLDSGDPDDIAIEVGDTIGLCLQYFDNGTASSGQPAGCVLVANQQSNYVDVSVQRP